MSETLLRTTYAPFVFYELDKKIFLPRVVAEPGKYAVVPYYPTKDLDLPVTIYTVKTLTQDVGFLFEPSMPYILLSTGLLLYSGAWRERARSLSFKPDDIDLVFKADGLYIHSALNKCCIVSISNIDDSMTTILTAI